MPNFDLERFKNGEPVRTKDNSTGMLFVAILPEGTPARLVVRKEYSEAMENYFLDGSYIGANHPSDQDLVMAGYLDR